MSALATREEARPDASAPTAGLSLPVPDPSSPLSVSAIVRDLQAQIAEHIAREDPHGLAEWETEVVDGARDTFSLVVRTYPARLRADAELSSLRALRDAGASAADLVEAATA